MSEFFADYFSELRKRSGDADEAALRDLGDAFAEAREGGKKVIIAGNGGSAAIASHIAVDLTKTANTRCMCFNDASLITCFANDYGHDNWLAKAIEAYSDQGDVAVLISSSGRSLNIINAARHAAEAGLYVVTLSGFDQDNPLRSLGQMNLWVDSRSYNVVETVHQTWLLAAMDRVISEVAPR